MAGRGAPGAPDYLRLVVEVGLEGVFGQRSADPVEAITLLGSGQISGDPLITDRLLLSQVQAALDRFLEPSSVKVVVTPDAG